MTKTTFTAALALLACGSSSTSRTEASLSSIAVTPAAPTVTIGSTQQFTAMGTDSDGKTQDLTQRVAWASSSTSAATISAAGLATAVGASTTTISATMSGVTGNATLTVTGAGPTVTSASLPGGTQNVAYSATLAATGGTLPYSWSLASGALPTGLSLDASTGAISGTPTAAGSSDFTVRVTDGASTMATKALSIAIAAPTAHTYTLWASSAAPAVADGGPDSAVELGVKFRSDVDGVVTGVRFYKAAANTGTHVGNLWSAGGTNLATATFTGESASGWQQVSFATPVPVSAGTVYVASYHTGVGHYSADQGYFSSHGVDSLPLHALAEGVSGANGVYAYGASSAFPSSGASSTNYWVDVVFSTDAAIPPPPPPPGAPEPAGWYAGDMHVHRSCGESPAPVSSMYDLMAPQNLAVISLLADMGNGEVQTPSTDLPLVNGQQDDPVSTPGRIVHWDAEWHWDPIYLQYPHQVLGGHLVVLGVSEAHQDWSEYTFPVLDWARKSGGIAGFAHLQYLDNAIPQDLSCCTPIEYPVEVALGASDFISEDVVDTDANSVFTNMDPEAAIKAYYRLLNCGFRPGFAAGTDYPCNMRRGVGNLLTYSHVASGQMTYRSWIDAIKNGRTVVSRNGHNEFLNLVVNGSATPGDDIQLAAAGSVPVTVQWTANQSLSGTIELVSNGVVVASKAASVTAGAPATLTATVSFPKSGWLAARRMGSSGHQVHTAAVFVMVAGKDIRASADDANFYVQWMDNLLTKTSSGGAWNSFFPTSLAAAQARYQAAKAKYQQIASEVQ